MKRLLPSPDSRIRRYAQTLLLKLGLLYPVRRFFHTVLQYDVPGYTFNDVAQLYDEVRPGYPDELIEDVIRISGIPHDGRILEVGCGTGQATVSFAQRGYAMLCLDIGAHLVKIARAKCQAYPRVEIRRVAFEEWRPERNAFDLLVSGTAFHWVEPNIRYHKAATVLKDTGYLALFWNRRPTPRTGFFQDVRTVYQQVAPRWDTPSDREHIEATIRQRAQEIEESNLFDSVQVKRYPWSITYSTDKYLKLLTTQSGQQYLPKAQRPQLYAEIQHLIDEKYDGKVTRPILSVLYIAKKKV
jgi:SAM-dependent methyltransferase